MYKFKVTAEYIDFTSKSDILHLGQAIGDVDEDARKRLQIRQTIEKHLDRELALNPQGIKVLSLFFIDRVANYRSYDAAGNVIQGKYAQWFEAEYKALVAKPKYQSLFGEIDPTVEVTLVHDGYFSADKRKKGDADSLVRFKDSNGTTADDENTYNLIMKDKEKLLSFDSKLRFIFSHSALREGWDNPNVFQICTLNETASTIKKRQEIGRGLRLAVNQQGERIQGFAVNTLTIMANESYEDFAAKLQQEYEQDVGIRFDAKKHIKNADKGQKVELNKQVYLSPEFSMLWDRIKHKTTYRVDFTPANLIAYCASKLRDDLIVGKTRFESNQ